MFNLHGERMNMVRLGGRLSCICLKLKFVFVCNINLKHGENVESYIVTSLNNFSSTVGYHPFLNMRIPSLKHTLLESWG